MKRRIILLVVLTIVFTTVLSFGGLDTGKSVEAAPEFQRVGFVNAVVTATYLNVRQGAGTNFPIVCVLKKGQTVKVFGKLGDWYAVYEPRTGCVGAASSRYLQAAGTTPAPAPVKPPAPTPAPVKTPPPAPAKTPGPVVTPGPIPSPGPTTTPTGISQEEQKLLDLINAERSKAGIPPLAFDMPLQKVARLKAQDMVNNNYFSHQSPTYGSPFDMMRQFDVTFRTAGENIAGNQTLEGAVKAWMNSEGHRKNILNSSFNYTGIGIAPSPTYGKILVQQFIGK